MKRAKVEQQCNNAACDDPSWVVKDTYREVFCGFHTKEVADKVAVLLNENAIMKRLLSKKIRKQIEKEAKP